MAEPVGDPYVALAVDIEAAVDDCGLEILGFAWIRGREARHFIAGVRDPDPILLINGEVKWPVECDALRRCQRLAVLVEHRDRLAPVAGKPGVVLGVDRRAERAALHAAPG